MNLTEAVSFAYENLNANKVRTGLTMLGMIIGTASIILVVTIALTGRDYILQQIQGVGSNLIYFYYEAVGAAAPKTLSDDLTLGDLRAVQEVPAVAYATGIVTTRDRVMIEGKEREVSVIGATDGYLKVRNVRILSGRFWDDMDMRSSAKICLLTEEFARKLFGSLDVRGNSIKLYQARFEVIGVFAEGVGTFGQSEVSAYSVLIPLNVLRRFTMSDKLDTIYASARTGAMVPYATKGIQRLLEQRHRKGSAYRVQNMTAILQTARRIATLAESKEVEVRASHRFRQQTHGRTERYQGPKLQQLDNQHAPRFLERTGGLEQPLPYGPQGARQETERDADPGIDASHCGNFHVSQPSLPRLRQGLRDDIESGLDSGLTTDSKEVPAGKPVSKPSGRRDAGFFFSILFILSIPSRF